MFKDILCNFLDGHYELDLAVWDQREALKLLLRLAAIEPGENVRHFRIHPNSLQCSHARLRTDLTGNALFVTCVPLLSFFFRSRIKNTAHLFLNHARRAGTFPACGHYQVVNVYIHRHSTC